MGMTPLCVAIYARVSSEQQATSKTIDSQIAALEARLAQDGLCLTPDCRFIDEGYSGATLVRPALERLRDAVAAGNLDRLYVHSPDRLALPLVVRAGSPVPRGRVLRGIRITQRAPDRCSGRA